MIESTVTVLFDPPFWIALFECRTDGKYTVAREVIGTSEPTGVEMAKFFDRLGYDVHYSNPSVEAEVVEPRKMNFKKMQKVAQRSTNQTLFRNAYTKAQIELKKQHEAMQQERKQESKAKKLEIEELKFELRQTKRKEKHKGH